MTNISYTIPTAEETRANVKDHKDLNKAISEIVESITEECSVGGYSILYHSSDRYLLNQLIRTFRAKGYEVRINLFALNYTTHEITISWSD